MSQEIAHFQNFAKLKDTSLAFNDITVLAGKPSIGKSYVMKFMYAIDEASVLSETDKEKFHFIFRNILESVFGSIEQINSDFSYKNDCLDIEYSDNNLRINRHLRKNFGIGGFSPEKSEAKAVGSEFYKNSNKLEIKKSITSATFVETPLILEFEKFLPKEKFKTPYHIDSLLQELNKNDFSFTSDETSEFINAFRTSSSKVISGNISKGSSGFSFESKEGKSYNIINTSSGTKSIGLLQYLVTNKALKKGSVLYWEEPEVHLHPQWQLKMVELFVELMNAGIKIVFSTHSPYMADYLNAISKKRDFSDRVSFNLFKEEEGVVRNIILDNKSWDLLQEELLGTLEDIVWEYL